MPPPRLNPLGARVLQPMAASRLLDDGYGIACVGAPCPRLQYPRARPITLPPRPA